MALLSRDVVIHLLLVVLAVLLTWAISKTPCLSRLPTVRRRFLPILVGLTLVSGGYYYWAFLRQIYNFQIGGLDLAIFTQVVWKLSNGMEPWISPVGLHVLRDHFSPIWYLASPLLGLHASIEWLSLVHALCLGGSVLVCYLLAKQVTQNRILSFAISLSLLFNTFFQKGQMSSIHAESFGILILFLVLLFMRQRKWTLYYLGIVLAVLVKEDVGIYVVALGMYQLLTRENWRITLGSLTIGVIGILSSFYIPKLFGDLPAHMYLRYSFHEGIAQTILAALEGRKLYWIYVLLAQVGFLALFGHLSLIPLLFTIGVKSASNHPGMYSFQDHYALHVLPFLYFALIFGIQNLIIRNGWITGFVRQDVKTRQTTVAVFILLFALLVNFENGTNPLSRNFRPSRFVISEHSRIGHRVIALIPPKVSVATQAHIAPFLAKRPNLYVIRPTLTWWKGHTPPVNFEYVIIDTRPSKADRFDKTEAVFLDLLERSPIYKQVIEKDGWIIYRKISVEREEHRAALIFQVVRIIPTPLLLHNPPVSPFSEGGRVSPRFPRLCGGMLLGIASVSRRHDAKAKGFPAGGGRDFAG